MIAHAAIYAATVYDALMMRRRAWLAADAGEATTEAFHAIAKRQGCAVARQPDGTTLATDPQFLAGKAVEPKALIEEFASEVDRLNTLLGDDVKS